MSLTVYPYKRNLGNDQIIEITDAISSEYTNLFGLESWRFRVWGATALKEMECEILPTLSKMDIYAEEEELYKLEQELIKVLHHTEKLSVLLKVNKDSLVYRVKNALAAINIAKKHQNGGVCIG